jgi:hypothetical protein
MLMLYHLVSGSPDDPAGCDEDLSEDWAAKISPSLYDHI